jgi:Arc/MetJ-type ribon-helix-helix transcriptional regulator
VTTKSRLSASVDAALLSEVDAAVARGPAPTLSAWVSDALRLKLEHDRRLAALADFVRGYEAEHGEISVEEMRQAARRARSRAIVVRGKAETRHAATPRRKATK